MASAHSSTLFSNQKHAEGRWDTRTSYTRNPAVRFLVSYMSFKREGIDKLAKAASGARFVLDAGCGKGAYSHWFLGRNCLPCVVAADWSFQALRAIRLPERGRILRVCADVQRLPFKSESISALFSVDTLGHIRSVTAALDEFVRVCERNSPLFIHSECGNYRTRWPDRTLVLRLGRDVPAQQDGHCSLYRAEELYSMYSQRFFVRSFFNPAGYAGWLLGYPEKYLPAFLQARWRLTALIAALMAALKSVGVFRVCLRLINAMTNHAEKYFGLNGGGSCFAQMQRP